jgi:hypothetical protein
MVTMEYNLKPQFSKTHLTTLNLNNFKMFETVGLNVLHCFVLLIYITFGTIKDKVK